MILHHQKCIERLNRDFRSVDTHEDSPAIPIEESGGYDPDGQCGNGSQGI
ncbi:hypothetical protein [Duncaniella freteri]